jgi:hypothetical protein
MILKIRTSGQGNPTPASAEKPNFAALRPRRPRAAASFFLSLGLHATVVLIVNTTVQAVNTRRQLLHEPAAWSALQMPIASNVLPPRLVDPNLSRQPSQADLAGHSTPTGSAPPAVRSAAPPPTPADSGRGGDPASPEARQERRFQLPVTKAKQTSRQVLVRLEVPPDAQLKADVAVPRVFLWQLPEVAKPRQELVPAAHREEPPVPERQTPAVDPQLTARNREQELARLRHASAPPVPVPTLPLPVANTTPIRLLDGIQGNSLPNSTGPVVRAPEPVHVISVPDLPVPQARVVVLPQGNQGTPPPAPMGQDTAGGTQSSSHEGGQQGASNQRRGAGSGSDAATNSSQASNQPGKNAGISSRVDITGTSNRSVAVAGGNGATASNRPPAGAREGASAANVGGGLPPAAIARIDRPNDGKYNVVVLGSSNLDAYPEAAGILSGKLVYTVYIRAGGRKEWILEYCLPKAIEQAVKLRGSAVPVEAPFPFLMYRPNLKLMNDPEYVVVHGLINTGGRFEHLSALGDIDPPSTELLIAVLEKWEFRPASRDGEPSAVEIALIIPRDPM